MSPNLGSCWGSFGTQSVREGLLDFRQAGVGLGDKPAVCGDCPRSLVFAECVPAPLGAALGDAAHAGGAGDPLQWCAEVFVVDESVLCYGDQFYRIAVAGPGNC